MLVPTAVTVVPGAMPGPVTGSPTPIPVLLVIFKVVEATVRAPDCVVAVLMPLFGVLFDQHRYQAGYVLAALCPAAGVLVWQALSGRVARVALDRMVA